MNLPLKNKPLKWRMMMADEENNNITRVQVVLDSVIVIYEWLDD
jgi:hypothetical protein